MYSSYISSFSDPVSILLFVSSARSLDPLFGNPRLGDDLKALLKSTFPEFYQPGEKVCVVWCSGCVLGSGPAS